MKIVEWKDEYNVGVEIIDQQHQSFFGMLNDLSTVIAKQKEKEKLMEIYGRVLDYANFHFQTEEKYFKEFDYKNTDKHIATHNAYREKIKSLKDNLENDTIVASFDLINYMEDWMINHILNEDRKYIKCFHENGLK